MKKTPFPRLIGVIHLPALPGAPRAGGGSSEMALQMAGKQAVEEVRILEKLGFESVILENFGDVPFYKERVPAETVAAMSIVAAAVRESTRLCLGLNVLRNDAASALAIASVCGADFIRVNVLCGVVATDQGLIEGPAAHLIRERDRLKSGVRIFADAHVKHAKTLSSEKIENAMGDLVERALADAVIVTGEGTGKKTEPEHLMRAGRAARELRVPLYVGSGTTPEDLPMIMQHAWGVIVGSALRQGGQAGRPLEPRRVKEFVRAFNAAARGPRKKRR